MTHAGRGQCRILHDGDLTGHLRQQPHRPAQHVIEVDATLQEVQDGLALGARERLDVLEPVDEFAVALFRGNAPRAGVRLGDVTLGLQHGHIVADGGAGNAQAVPVDQGLGADGLLGGDVVGDDGAQHLETPVIRTCHGHLPRA
ncbi:Uncharacterised protein [Mycobacteroides abscessus subsp. abscessus]|nr:Uncharacterised protein [Mycobacteroides abscessus subsp. abscessus]SKU24710.1 Uncharacterised protein [Mycobacteroides abscessus subsp. abscessus]